MFPYPILPHTLISQAFLELGVTTFDEACLYIQNLPYKRNANKADVFCVLKEQCGTCSTKHAVLKQLADEMGLDEVQLICGIYKMNAVNTPAVATTLLLHQLEYIPEAHNYLKYKNQIFDFTKTEAINFADDLIEEVVIVPSQIGEYKVKYHQQVLQKWLDNHPHIPYTLPELWTIREQCIQEIAKDW